jgi:hypothetical protein
MVVNNPRMVVNKDRIGVNKDRIMVVASWVSLGGETWVDERRVGSEG